MHNGTPDVAVDGTRRWDNGTWDHTPFWQWALDEVAYAVGDSSQGTAAPSKSSQGEAVRPPAAAPCELWISPQQKIVLVVHRGPAATVLLHASGLCHDPRGVKAQACFRRVTQADARAAGGDKAFWQSHR